MKRGIAISVIVKKRKGKKTDKRSQSLSGTLLFSGRQLAILAIWPGLSSSSLL